MRTHMQECPQRVQHGHAGGFEVSVLYKKGDLFNQLYWTTDKYYSKAARSILAVFSRKALRINGKMSQYNHTIKAQYNDIQYNKDATNWYFSHSIINSSPSKVLLFLSLPNVPHQNTREPYSIIVSKSNRSSMPTLKHSSHNFRHHHLTPNATKLKFCNSHIIGQCKSKWCRDSHPICK